MPLCMLTSMIRMTLTVICYPPQCMTIHIYVPPDKRNPWSIKTKKGFYIGTSMHHYCYYMGWYTKTRSAQELETMYFKPKYITDPGITFFNVIVQASK